MTLYAPVKFRKITILPTSTTQLFFGPPTTEEVEVDCSFYVGKIAAMSLAPAPYDIMDRLERLKEHYLVGSKGRE